MTSLGYSGNDNSLTSRAGEGRESLNLNYQAFYDSFYTLAYYNVAATTPNSRVAQSLLVMIQYLSEAARFTDVRGFISARVGDYSNSDATLPLFQQYLESNWARISQFGADITNNPNAQSLTLAGINRNNTGQSVTLYSWSDVVSYLFTLLDTNEVNNPNMGGYWQDWNHSEL